MICEHLAICFHVMSPPDNGRAHESHTLISLHYNVIYFTFIQVQLCPEKNEMQCCLCVAVLRHATTVYSRKHATPGALSERSDARHPTRFNQPGQSR